MQKIGLLAGVGNLPVECAKAAKALGIEVYAIALLPDTDKGLKDICSDYAEISIGQIGKIIEHLQQNDIKKVTMLGKVTKELLFSGEIIPDAKAMAILASLTDKSDDAIMLALVKELGKIGIEPLNQTELIRPLMPAAGTLTSRELSDAEKIDIELGMRMAREIGRLDVGQTAVVKNGAVMALEAIEGTDAAILRGGELARGGAVVCKAAKPQQDSRFDVPTVGLNTIEIMAGVGAKVLAIEAGKTILVDRERAIALAEANGIAIVAVK